MSSDTKETSQDSSRHVLLAVDVGGTFTDVAWVDVETGTTGTAKVLSTPEEPDRGIATAFEEEQELRVLLPSVESFMHGTTVGLNALLTRKGAAVALLTTEGMRDVLELRRGDREEAFSLTWAPPAPLVRRRWRLPVAERVLADGTVETPLALADVEEAYAAIAEAGIESVAISFINAYANPEHELQAAAHLRALGFAGGISLSHQVTGEYREYERTSTTAVDAFVGPVISGYVTRLRGVLDGHGARGEAYMMRSGGGAITFGEATERPFEVIMSGPVGGAVGAGALARKLDLATVVTADVGGTSFDTCLLLDGRLPVLYEGRVGPFVLQTPWVDVRSIGSGGGSIVHASGGLLQVGPQSAGASPGPACYARGGTQPTVTDAAACLGMFGEPDLAGGVTLDLDRASAALARVASAFAMDVVECAEGVVKIAAAAMANAIREITIEQGRDPRTAALMAFGGAGPLLAIAIAEELDMSQVVVPKDAGNFSARGLLEADVVRDRARTVIRPATPDGWRGVRSTLGELLQELTDDDPASTVRSAFVDLRYGGQEHTLTLPVEIDGGTADAAVDEFRQAYLLRFGHTPAAPVEVVCVRAQQRRPASRPRPTGAAEAPSGPGTKTTRAFSFAACDWRTFAVVDRGTLREPLSGPAILRESTTTTYLDEGWVARGAADGALVLTKEGSR